MYAIINKTSNGEENLSERSGVGYWQNEEQAKFYANQVNGGGITLVREVDKVYMASQNYLHRMRGDI